MYRLGIRIVELREGTVVAITQGRYPVRAIASGHHLAAGVLLSPDQADTGPV
jgi:hypothetical protein